jgi:hypothetical protein
MREFRITFGLTADNIHRLKGDVAEERNLDTTASTAELFAEYLETVLRAYDEADGIPIQVWEAEEVFDPDPALPELADDLHDLATELQHIKLRIDDIIQAQEEETDESSPNQPE